MGAICITINLAENIMYAEDHLLTIVALGKITLLVSLRISLPRHIPHLMMLTLVGNGIKHFRSLTSISQRAHIIEGGNVADMGNIQKTIVHGHLELSHPLESVSDKLICRGDQVKAIEK